MKSKYSRKTNRNIIFFYSDYKKLVFAILIHSGGNIYKMRVYFDVGEPEFIQKFNLSDMFFLICVTTWYPTKSTLMQSLNIL